MTPRELAEKILRTIDLNNELGGNVRCAVESLLAKALEEARKEALGDTVIPRSMHCIALKEAKDMMEAVAKELAHSDDTTQAEFLNTFAKELQIVCRGKTQSQICYLSDKLDRDGTYLIDELHDFIALRKTQKANP